MSPPKPRKPRALWRAASAGAAVGALLLAACRAQPPASDAGPPVAAAAAPGGEGYGPQAPPDQDVLPALRPCMDVGRTFAKMPAADRLDAVVDGCAAALRPPCAAALRALRDASPDAAPDAGTAAGADPTADPQLSPAAAVISACAEAYCPDLVARAGVEPPVLCGPRVGDTPTSRSRAQLDLLTAALSLDYPTQRHGLDLLAGVLLSALPAPAAPSPAPPPLEE